MMNLFISILYGVFINQNFATATSSVHSSSTKEFRGEKKLLKRQEAQLKEILSICKTISTSSSADSVGDGSLNPLKNGALDKTNSPGSSAISGFQILGGRRFAGPNGDTLETASSDYCIVDNIYFGKDGNGTCKPGNGPIKTAVASSVVELSSSLTNDELNYFTSLQFSNPSGSYLSLKIDGFMRNNNSVTFFTTLGLVTLNGTEISFSSTNTVDYFELAGFDTIPLSSGGNRRRLATTTTTAITSSVTTSVSPTTAPTNRPSNPTRTPTFMRTAVPTYDPSTYFYEGSVSTYALNNWYTKCGFTTLSIGSSLTSIGDSAFYTCSLLTSIMLTSGLLLLGSKMFSMNSGATVLTSVTIPSTITSIGDSSFFSCSSLTFVSIVSGLLIIGPNMFNMNGGSTMLASITIPSTITSLGAKAFYLCTLLSKIKFINGLTIIGDNMFSAYGGTKVWNQLTFRPL